MFPCVCAFVVVVRALCVSCRVCVCAMCAVKVSGLYSWEMVPKPTLTYLNEVCICVCFELSFLASALTSLLLACDRMFFFLRVK